MLENADTMSLADFGIDGVVRHTGGHTAGSIAVELASQDVLVGDLVASGILLGGIILSGWAKRPPFEDDPSIVSRQLQRLVTSGGERFYMGHGGPLGAAEVMRHARYLARIAAPHCQDPHCDQHH